MRYSGRERNGEKKIREKRSERGEDKIGSRGHSREIEDWREKKRGE